MGKLRKNIKRWDAGKRKGIKFHCLAVNPLRCMALPDGKTLVKDSCVGPKGHKTDHENYKGDTWS